MHALKIIWFFILFIIVESKLKLSDLVPICSISDPDINECIISSTTKFIPHMIKGIREWNLVPLDPVFIPRMFIGQKGGPVTFEWEHTNSTVRGMGKFKVKKFTFNKARSNYYFNFTTTSDEFSVTGDYKGRGKVIFLPLQGEGREEIHAGYSQWNMFIHCKENLKSSGKKHLSIEKLKIKLLMKKVRANMSNVFDERTEFGKAMKKFIDDNIDEIINDMAPAFQDTIEELMKSYIQKLLDRVSLDEMFKS